MSIPINHHHVSRCQSDNFLDTLKGKIFVLNKENHTIKFKTSTKRLFSENHSNTKISDNNEVDSESLEMDLRVNYEDHFNKNVKTLKNIIENPNNSPIDLKGALDNLTKFGIIGQIRNPNTKRINDKNIADILFNKISPYAAPQLKKELQDLEDRLNMTNYSNAVKYSEFAEMAFERMGDIRFRIYYIMPSDRYFFLPDVSSISTKARINNYFNSDNNEIAIVGTPLTSKIFLHSQSAKLGNLSNSIHKIQDDVFPSEIERINYGLYTGSYKEIACESQEYLEKFRDNLDLIKNYVFSK